MPASIFFILAAICYAIDALKAIIKLESAIQWTPAGHCFVVIGVWLS